MMMWRKPDGMKYTDMCIYIDENAEKLMYPGKYEEEENLIYNYIWLLVKALAIKKRMFDSFNDYDGYAMHSASRLFFALRKSYMNEGKVIKGKTIKPIKSILNYTKALLYPMKLEYLNEQYASLEKASSTAKRFDEFVYKQHIKDDVWYSQGGKEKFKQDMESLFSDFDSIVDSILEKSPFNKNSIDYKKMKISVMLNCLQNLKNNKTLNMEPVTVIVWKLPKSMGNYIRLYIKEVGALMQKEIIASYSSTEVDDRTVNYLVSNPSGEFIENES